MRYICEYALLCQWELKLNSILLSMLIGQASGCWRQYMNHCSTHTHLCAQTHARPEINLLCSFYSEDFPFCNSIVIRSSFCCFLIYNNLSHVLNCLQRIKQLGIPDLLVQLPALQELLFRLLSCQVMHHSVILLKFTLILVSDITFFPVSRAAWFSF